MKQFHVYFRNEATPEIFTNTTGNDDALYWDSKGGAFFVFNGFSDGDKVVGIPWDSIARVELVR